MDLDPRTKATNDLRDKARKVFITREKEDSWKKYHAEAF